MYQSSVVAACLALLYLALVAVPIIMLYHRNCVNSHAVFSLFGTGLIGLAMLAFRMLRGLRTSQVKYFHLVVHVSAVFALIYGLFILFWQPYSKREQVQVVHRYPSLIVLGALIMQVIAGMAFFLSISNVRLRLAFAPLHDIFGIWLFLCLAGCCLAGSIPLSEYESSAWTTTFFLCFIIGILIVLSVVLSPYFEWELRGNL